MTLVLILLLSFGLNIAGITWGLPNYADWAADTIVPFDMLQGAYQRFSHGWHTFYPPVHFFLLAICTAPYILYLMATGGLQNPEPLFPFGLADPLTALTQVILIARLVSVAMGVGIVLITFKIVQTLFDRRAAVFASLIVTLYYPLVYSSHNANVDVPYIFWSFLATFFFVHALRDGRLRQYVLFAVFATVAISTKDQAYGLFLLAPLPLLWLRFSETSTQEPFVERMRRVLLDKRLLIAFAAALATFAVAQNLFLNFSGFWEHVQTITGPERGDFETHARDLGGRALMLRDVMTMMAVSMTIPVFVVCAAGTGYCLWRFPRSTAPVLFLAATYYLLFINVALQLKVRFLIPIVVIVAFFGGKLLGDLWTRADGRLLVRGCIVLLFAYAATFPIQLDALLIGDPRYEAEDWLERRAETGDIIETFAPRASGFKHYPRMPSRVRMRGSQIEAGDQWLPTEIPPNMIMFPNVYMGREPPDFIVLSEFFHRLPEAGLTNPGDDAPFLADLAEGRTPYSLAATFKTETWVPIRYLPVNSRITIFRRDAEVGDREPGGSGGP